ncbi:MAG TPA: autotransporter domain-containing protein [Lysobacter sp.]|nr:autotransporter domain-containing protein [Lysobacter sp.]
MKNRSTRAARAGLARSLLSCAVAAGLAVGAALPAAAQQAPAETGSVGDPDSWRTREFNADWGLAAINAQYAYARGLTGRGVRLGVFDSGSALGHGEFAGKNHRGIRIADLLGDGSRCTNTVALDGPDACFSSDGGSASVDYFEYTDEDRALVQYLVAIGYLYDWVPEYLESLAGFQYGTHGTHVAGTMAANRDGRGTHGVAFNADLSAARLFSNTYQDLYALLGVSGGQSRAIGPDSSAVEDMYAQLAAQGVRAINHSWGLSTEPNTAADMDELYHLPGVDRYFQTYADPSLKGHVLQVFAAGNNNGDIAGIYATLPRYVDGLEKYWLSVVNINAGGTIDGSSSICGLSRDWCVTAPGTDIASTVVGGRIDGSVVRDADGNVVGLDITGQQPEYGYGYMTGTSMAAPHVTGALALLMERFPYLDNPQIRDVLLTTATDLGAQGVDEVYGWGLIDLKKAIEGPGLLRVDTDVVMNRRAGGTQTWAGLAWDNWTNDIGGPGRLTKSGAGWLRLSGDNAFAGATVKQGVLELTGDNALTAATSVDGGVFLLGGRLSGSALTVNAGGMATVDGRVAGAATRVNAGGRLGGTGTLDGLSVYGTVAPGNGLGTLRVDGTYVQGAGSFFDAEIGANGASDRIDVAGNAVLQGGTVRLSGPSGTYLLGQQYTLLNASGGVTGQFQALDRSAFSPFLRFDLAYGANAIGLNVARGMALADAGGTANQRRIGAAADAMPVSSALLTSLTRLFPAQAQAAFDALGGEAHASTRVVLVETSRHVREAALARGLSQHAPDASAEGRTSVWAQGLATGGHVDGDGNAARIDAQGSGVLVGADHAFAGGWTVGGLIGRSEDDLGVGARASRGDARATQLAVYGGGRLGGFGLKGGVAWADHDIDMRRRVAFGDVDQTLLADYGARTLQGFVEGSWRVEGGHWAVEPYAQVAHVRVDAERFGETGGSAALTVEGDSRVNLSSAGVRFALMPAARGQAPGWLQLRGGVGYRHASGDVDSATQAAWAGGGTFTVQGATLARNAWTAEAGIGAWLSPRTLLELGYTGQYGDGARDHGATARISVQF